MTNALFDIDVGSHYVYPYLGIGVGYQSTHLNDFALTQINRPYSFTASGDAGGFATQIIGGAAFPIPNMPGLSLTIDYRVIDVLAGEKFSGASSFGPGTAALPGETKFHNQFNQTAMIGVRYAFNTPPPAAPAQPPAPPPAAQSQSYQVYFGLNEDSLNGRNLAIVQEAATAAEKGATTRIEVTGNADTSGNAAANQALSERRAKAVAAALVRDGVAKDAISIQARGDTNPAVPTGPGVEEAKNRRVEIVLR
jgi:outer membrane protein OmpA-like peptidoglycan-associated protein